MPMASNLTGVHPFQYFYKININFANEIIKIENKYE